jgi:hypothetical protein
MIVLEMLSLTPSPPPVACGRQLLELGGKNAAIVDEKVDSMVVAARRLAWGVAYNCGLPPVPAAALH